MSTMVLVQWDVGRVVSFVAEITGRNETTDEMDFGIENLHALANPDYSLIHSERPIASGTRR